MMLFPSIRRTPPLAFKLVISGARLRRSPRRKRPQTRPIHL